MNRPLAFGLAWALAAWNLAALLGFAVSPVLTTLSVPIGLAVGTITFALVRRRVVAGTTTPEVRSGAPAWLTSFPNR